MMLHSDRSMPECAGPPIHFFYTPLLPLAGNHTQQVSKYASQSLFRLIGVSLIVLWSVPSLSQSVPSWATGRDATVRQADGELRNAGHITFLSEHNGTHPPEAEIRRVHAC